MYICVGDPMLFNIHQDLILLLFLHTNGLAIKDSFRPSLTMCGCSAIGCEGSSMVQHTDLEVSGRELGSWFNKIDKNKRTQK